MSADPLDDVVVWLDDNGYGTDTEDLFKAYMPETPDALVVVSQYNGEAPQYVMGSDTPSFEHIGVQVRVRDTDYTTARQTINDIYLGLPTMTGETIGGTRYIQVRAVTSPLPLLRDAQQRHHFTCNFILTRETT